TDERDVARIGPGMYRVVVNGRAEIVWIAATASERWAFWNGQLFTIPVERERTRPRHTASETHQSIAAPMPGTVLKVLVAPGAAVRKGDTLIILEAMKMELPLRATADGTVRAVSCREGELVQAGAVLADLQ